MIINLLSVLTKQVVQDHWTFDHLCIIDLAIRIHLSFAKLLRTWLGDFPSSYKEWSDRARDQHSLFISNAARSVHQLAAIVFFTMLFLAIKVRIVRLFHLFWWRLIRKECHCDWSCCMNCFTVLFVWVLYSDQMHFATLP